MRLPAHQPADDLDGALVACISSRPHQHRQEQRHKQVLLQQLLVVVQHHGGGGLEDQQAEEPATGDGKGEEEILRWWM